MQRKLASQLYSNKIQFYLIYQGCHDSPDPQFDLSFNFDFKVILIDKIPFDFF